jgi:hypothetical protein
MSAWLGMRAGEPPRHRADLTFSPEAALQRRAARLSPNQIPETNHA